MRPTIERRTAGRGEDGAVALLVAVGLSMLLVAAALVLDFGVVRLDRQMNKSSSDAAVAAGLQGLDQGDGAAHSYAGVCQALTYLRLSQSELAGLPDASNAPGGNVTCPPTAAQLAEPCEPGVTNATYAATVGRLSVTIVSPYTVDEGDFPEEELDSLSEDTGKAGELGCDQLAVIVSETQSPGLGSLATTADLASRVRSVGRITVGSEGEGAVALLMLEPKECLVIDIDGNGASVTVEANGDTPGLIHANTTARGDCNDTGKTALQGDHASGIIAKATTGTPSVPGMIRLHALTQGSPYDTYDIDSDSNVVAEGGVVEEGPVVSREPIDNRYIVGVRAAVVGIQDCHIG